MHSINFAEWILALVTTRDRAATTVGDLAEGSAARGGFWFWSGVLRTAARLLWRGVAEEPARVTGLAFAGLAVYIGMDLLFAALSGGAFFVVSMATGHPVHLDSIGWRLWFAAPLVLSSLCIGRMLARWAPGRELAACLAFVILASIYDLVPMLGDNGVFSVVSCLVLVPAGTVWGRRHRRLRAT